MSLLGSEQWMYSSGGAASFYDHEIDGSLRFNDNDSAWLSRTPSSAGDRRSWTWSGWIKRSQSDSDQILLALYLNGGNDQTMIRLRSGGALQFGHWNGSGYDFDLRTSALLRDHSAWYHIVCVLNTTSATSSYRASIYINGEKVSAFSTESYPSQNYEADVNSTNPHGIGRFPSGVSYYDGYMAEINFVDGQTLQPTDFGETKSGVWIPKAYSGSYGTNGYYLKFAGNANDSSGNGNNWTANNISSYDYVPDSPTNNFATLNPLWTYNSANSGTTYSEGNLKYAMTSSNSRGAATMQVLADGCYFEMMAKSSTCAIGVQSIDGQTRYTWNAVNNGELSNIGGTDPAGFTDGDIVAVAVGTDGNIKLYKNGTLQGTDNTLTGYTSGDPLVPLLGEFATAASNTIIANFGQDSTFAGATTAGGNSDANGYGDFKYAPPSGYLALCTANLTVAEGVDPALDASPQDHFNTVLWTGNGATNRNITGVGFQPDFLWIKNRSNGGNNHHLFNAVIGMPNHLSTDLVYSEATATNKATAFLSDGFTIQDHSSVNASGQSYVAWNWKANGSGASNTSGSITSTVSANTDVGFSIVSYTGNGSTATVGHGLGKAPSFIVTKCRTQSSDWPCYHASEGATRYGNINEAASWSTNSSPWNNTAPTSSVFTVGGSYGTNWPSQPLIAYCFAEIEGYSSIGSYIGNGSSDGAFVYTGFRPAMIIYKSPEVAEVWYIHDDKRIGYNPENRGQYIQSDVSEYDLDRIDILSNGFKLRSTDSDSNFSGRKYIYMAFAENPFKYANAR